MIPHWDQPAVIDSKLFPIPQNTSNVACGIENNLTRISRRGRHDKHIIIRCNFFFLRNWLNMLSALIMILLHQSNLELLSYLHLGNNYVSYQITYCTFYFISFITLITMSTWRNIVEIRWYFPCITHVCKRVCVLACTFDC